MKPWIPEGPTETYRVRCSAKEFEQRLPNHLRHFRLKPVTVNGVAAYRAKAWRPGLQALATIEVFSTNRGTKAAMSIFVDSRRRWLDRSVAGTCFVAFALAVIAWGVTQVGPMDVLGFVSFVVVSIPFAIYLTWLLWRQTSYEALLLRRRIRLLLWRELDVQIPKALIVDY